MFSSSLAIILPPEPPNTPTLRLGCRTWTSSVQVVSDPPQAGNLTAEWTKDTKLGPFDGEGHSCGQWPAVIALSDDEWTR